jgi:hypothetical protein
MASSGHSNKALLARERQQGSRLPSAGWISHPNFVQPVIGVLPRFGILAWRNRTLIPNDETDSAR